MTITERLLTAAAWAAAGALVGVLIRFGSVWLARKEELEPGFRRWQVLGPPIAAAALFAVFGFELGPHPILLLRSLWVAVLVQIIFFDIEHRLILDRVLLPSMVLAIGLSIVTPNLGWKQSLVIGLAAGLLFLFVAVVGSFVFRVEALGMGDVKLACFMGLLLGIRSPYLATGAALFYGTVLAGGLALLMVAVRLKSMKDSIAYGPYLAAGTLIVMFQAGSQYLP